MTAPDPDPYACQTCGLRQSTLGQAGRCGLKRAPTGAEACWIRDRTHTSLSAGPETTMLWEILLLSGADISAYGHETRTQAGRETCFQEWLRRGSVKEVVEAVRELRRDYDQACNLED